MLGVLLLRSGKYDGEKMLVMAACSPDSLEVFAVHFAFNAAVRP
jgi:hypothetical protein